MAVAYIKPVLMIYELQKFDDVIVIVKRLADTHHNDVRYPLTRGTLGGNDLPVKLGRIKIAHLAADGRRTEFASHAASNLA